MCFCSFIFFFQAEDGIRDTSVTGVQTCALPISPSREKYNHFSFIDLVGPNPGGIPGRLAFAGSSGGCSPACYGAPYPEKRSEERRVGKECRTRGWADH